MEGKQRLGLRGLPSQSGHKDLSDYKENLIECDKRREIWEY
jgi:hypothetical protein